MTKAAHEGERGIWGMGLIGAIARANVPCTSPRIQGEHGSADQRSSMHGAVCAVSTHQRKTLSAGSRVGSRDSAVAGRMAVLHVTCKRESGKEGKLNPEEELMSAAKGEERNEGR